MRCVICSLRYSLGRRSRSGSPGRRSGIVVIALAFALYALTSLGTALAIAAGDANLVSCLNEASPGFRTYIPDCRAYEMVTPSYKGGGALAGGEIILSNGGERLIASGLDVFADAGDDNLAGLQGVHYELTRTASGWEPTALTPPASSRFTSSQFEGASADLSSTLWQLPAHIGEIGEEFVLFRREEDGVFVQVGPVFKTLDKGLGRLAFHYVGGSNDLTHVLVSLEAPFSSEAPYQLWPGDTTLGNESGVRSLYEYTGIGNAEPKLVGVRNEKALGSNSEAQLISECGTSLGSGEGHSAYNAISASGQEVFFTANAGECEGENSKRETVRGAGPPVNELYARVDGSKTVDISEPSLEDCGECLTATKAPAEFQGASADGTKVFFLTEQELLAGQKTKNLYEYDFGAPAGKKVVLVSNGSKEPEVQGVMRVTSDGSRVYFVASGVLTTEPNRAGLSPVVGEDNLYAYETVTGRLSFVATLSDEDEEDWARADQRPVEASQNGSYLVFESRAHLTSDDESGANVPQIFEYDAQHETLVRVSAGSSGDYFCAANGKVEGGYNCDGNTAENGDSPHIPIQIYAREKDLPTTAATELSITEDGSVFFLSADGLSPQAVKGTTSLYEYQGGNVYLISSGHDPASQEVELLGVNPSGENVFFSSTEHLVPQAADSAIDFYDARMNGGFPAPVMPAECTGERCQGSFLNMVLPPSVPASSSYPPGENFVSAPVQESSQSEVMKTANKSPKRKHKKAKSQGKKAKDKSRKAKAGSGRALRQRAGRRP
jgi:hypothetical protein